LFFPPPFLVFFPYGLIQPRPLSTNRHQGPNLARRPFNFLQLFDSVLLSTIHDRILFSSPSRRNVLLPTNVFRATSSSPLSPLLSLSLSNAFHAITVTSDLLAITSLANLRASAGVSVSSFFAPSCAPQCIKDIVKPEVSKHFLATLLKSAREVEVVLSFLVTH